MAKNIKYTIETKRGLALQGGKVTTGYLQNKYGGDNKIVVVHWGSMGQRNGKNGNNYTVTIFNMK